MYEQGYSQVKSAYDSILNAPLTDQANITTRDTYVKQAQEKLKNLASTDLSMQENVDAANNVFAPFWQDNMLLMDSAFTRSTQEEMQKGFRLRDSKNKEERDQYSDIAMQYIANGLDPLKNAGRNPEAYKNLEKRRFVPFVNEKEYWNTQAKTLNFEINWSDPSGPYLINTKNGQRAEQSFRAFAEGMISPQMENQYKIIGTVEKEGRVKQVKSLYPGVSDTQALEYIAKDVVTDIRKNFKTAIKGLTDESLSVQSKIEEFKKLGELTPAQTNRYNELRDYQDQLNNQIKLKDKEYAEVADDKSANAIELYNNITATPEYYFTKLARSRSINNWAAAAASNTSKKVEINPVWKEQNDVFYKQQQLNLENRTQNREDAKFNLEQEKFAFSKTQPKSGTTGSVDADGNYVPSVSDLERGDIIGLGTTDIIKAGSAMDLFQKSQSDRRNIAEESVLSMEGLGRVATSLPGVTPQDVITYFSAVKKGNQVRATGMGNSINLNTDEIAAKRKIDKALKEKTGIDITGPGNLTNALVSYSQQYFADKSKDGGTNLTPEDVRSLAFYNTGATARKEMIELENKRKELVNNQILSSKDEDVQKLVVSRSDGSKDIIGKSDISNLFKTRKYNLVDDVTGQRVEYSADDLSNLYMKGKLKWSSTSSGASANIDGRKYYQSDLKTTSGPWSLRSTYSNSIVDDIQKIENRFGKSSAVAKTFEKLNESIIPNIPEYNNKTGQIGVVMQFQMDGKITKGGTEKGTRLVQEITQASNRNQILVDGELSTDEDVNKAITQLGRLGEKDLEKYFSSIEYNTATKTVKLRMPPLKTSDKTEVMGMDLNKLADKEIEISLSPNATGPTINSLPKNEGNYIYSSLLRGKAMKSDPMMSAANFSYEIVPDNTSNPTKAYVNITRKKYNSKSGKYEDVTIPTTTIDFYGTNKKTPDELVNELNSMFMLHLNENKTNEQLYKTHNSTNGLTKTVAQIEQERQAARVGQ